MALERYVRIKVDTDEATKGIKSLDTNIKGLDTTVTKTANSVKNGLDKNLKTTNKTLANFSRQSGQAGIQFQQFIGQIQGGVNPMVALSQQAADLGIVLGAPLLGAVVGISASLAGILIPSLLNSADSTQELIDKFTDLEKEGNATANQLEFLSIQRLKESQQTRIQIRETEENIKSTERQIKTYESLAEDIGSLTDVQRIWVASLPDLREELALQKAELDSLNQSLETTNETSKEATRLQDSLKDAFRARDIASTTILSGSGGLEQSPAVLQAEQETKLLLAEAQVRFEKQRELLEQNNLSTIELEILYEEQRTQIRQQGADNRERILQQEERREVISQQLRLGAISQTLNAAKQLGNAAFEDSKLLNAGFIAADTFVGVQRALTPAFPGAPPNFAAAALIAAAGAANVAKTLNASKGGGGVGGAGGSGGVTETPTEISRTLTVENSALTQLVDELRRFDPDEPLPAGFTQRIITSIDNAKDFGGE
jgi:hypothetical protein